MKQIFLAGSLAAIVLGGGLAQAEPIPGAPAANQNNVVGLASRDGISKSGLDVLVTRNGVSEKLTREMKLDSGLKIEPDGTMIGTDGSKILLRADQVVTFDGKLVNAPGSATRTGGAGPAGARALPQTVPPGK